MSKLDTEL